MNALYVVTLPALCRKICDNNDDVNLVTALEEGLNVPCGGIALPNHPVFSLILGILRSDPNMNCLPIIHDIICCVHLVGRVNSVQECPYGMRK